MKFKDWLWGNVRPTWRFWLIQFSALSFFLAFAFVSGIAIQVLLGALLPHGTFLTEGKFALYWIVTGLGLSCLQHSIAIFRAAKYAKTSFSKILCRLYAPAFIIAIITAKILQEIHSEGYSNDPRDGWEGLTAIEAHEKLNFKNNGHYSLNVKDLISELDRIPLVVEGSNKYIYLVTHCVGGIRDMSTIIEKSPALTNFPGRKDVEQAIFKQAEKENCKEHSDSFSSFAATSISPNCGPGGVELWRGNDLGDQQSFHKGVRCSFHW
jgi:hypothetical protein